MELAISLVVGGAIHFETAVSEEGLSDVYFR